MTVSDIGAEVRTRRQGLGLRQDELAGASGVGLRFIVDLEAGKSTIQLGKALQVLDALGLTLAVDQRQAMARG